MIVVGVVVDMIVMVVDNGSSGGGGYGGVYGTGGDYNSSNNVPNNRSSSRGGYNSRGGFKKKRGRGAKNSYDCLSSGCIRYVLNTDHTRKQQKSSNSTMIILWYFTIFVYIFCLVNRSTHSTLIFMSAALLKNMVIPLLLLFLEDGLLT